MIGKEIESITKDDIEALVTDAVSERRTLEYKQQLPSPSKEDTREFLADVSSFANAGGGDLIYGILDKRDTDGKPTGIPEAALGLADLNSDEQTRRLENIIRDGIDPRIPGIRVVPVDGFQKGPIIVLRVPKSWASPHMVKFDNLSRFFSRNSAGKYKLDVREIRASFLASENLGDKMSAFRSDRVGKILAGETPAFLQAGPKIVLHLLPVRAFAEPAVIDLRAAESTLGTKLVPLGPKANGWGPVQFNFNGLLCISGSGADLETGSYVQIFRNGAVEAVYNWVAKEEVLVGVALDQELVRGAPTYIDLQKRLGVEAPIFVAISAVSVKGFVISPRMHPYLGGMPTLRRIDHDVLLAPEALLERERLEVENLLRPALDTIWQASGWPGSQGYDEAGKWVGFAAWR